MQNLKVKEVVELCEQLGLDLGRAKRKHAIVEIMRKEEVSAEEINEARAEIQERREREEAELKERHEREEAEKQEQREQAEREERREQAERQERREEAERQERLELRRLELQSRQGSPELA